MNTTAAAPAISTLVEMTVSDERLCGVRVSDVDGARIDLALPPATTATRPAVGDAVTLRWPAGQRGRYALHGMVVEPTAADRLTVRVAGDPMLEQHRHYVRGGGGEQIWLHRPGSAGGQEFAGWIRDVSEQGVRAHFADTSVTDGDPLRLRIRLGSDLIDVAGTALKVAALPEAVPSDPARVEVIAVFAADEVQAQVIRRYVLQQQLLARARTAGD